MPTGVIKWFNNTKGWGFITSSEEKEEVFVHFSAIIDKGYKTLFSGQKVTYLTKKRLKGVYASDVLPVTQTKKPKQKEQKK